MVKLVNTRDLKSLGVSLTGSSPVFPTTAPLRIGKNMDKEIEEPKCYDILDDYNIDRLIAKVNKAIKEGWIPLGSAYIGEGDFRQTVIRKPPIGWGGPR